MNKQIRRIKKLLYRLTNRRVIRGHGNQFLFPVQSTVHNCKFYIYGDNNTIELIGNVRLEDVTVKIYGNNNVVTLEKGVAFLPGSMLWLEGEKSGIKVAEYSTFECCHLAASESKMIRIGRDSMFAKGVDIRTGDSHSILDAQTHKRTNPAEDVTIGNHVWCGGQTSILKGAVIPDHVIVGARSVVTKSSASKAAEGVVMAGGPAKVIDHGKTWQRELC